MDFDNISIGCQVKKNAVKTHTW